MAAGRDRPSGRSPPRRDAAAEGPAADERRRLIEAMVEVGGVDGYGHSSAAALAAKAQVTSETLFELFGERMALLRDAFDESSQAMLAEATRACERARDAGGLQALTRSLCRDALRHVGAIRLCNVEILAAEAAGVRRREALMAAYGDLIRDCLGPDTGRPMPQALAGTLAGSMHRAIDARVRAARPEELRSLAPRLASWARSYHPVPRSLRWSASEMAGAGDGVQPVGLGDGRRSTGTGGGRAPGSLTLAPPGYEPPVGDRARSSLAHLHRERVLDAVAQVSAEHGYHALTVAAIAERAGLSEGALLVQFRGRDEALAAAVEVGHSRGQAIVEQARAQTPGWSAGVRRATRALLDFLASEPAFTRMAFVEAPLANPAMARRLNEHSLAYARLLLEGASRRLRPPPAYAELVGHSLFELAFAYAAKDTIPDLAHAAGQAAYLALAPFVGVEEAAGASA